MQSKRYSVEIPSSVCDCHCRGAGVSTTDNAGGICGTTYPLAARVWARVWVNKGQRSTWCHDCVLSSILLSFFSSLLAPFLFSGAIHVRRGRGRTPLTPPMAALHRSDFQPRPVHAAPKQDTAATAAFQTGSRDLTSPWPATSKLCVSAKLGDSVIVEARPRALNA